MTGTGLTDGATVQVVRGAATAEEAVAVLLALDLARAADTNGTQRSAPDSSRRAREAASRIRLGPLHELKAASR